MSPIFTDPVEDPDSVCFVVVRCRECDTPIYARPEITVFYCPVCEPDLFREANPDADMSAYQSR